MLDAHSQLAIPPETNFAVMLKAFDRDGAGAAVEAAVRSRHWGDFAIPAEDFARRVAVAQPAEFGDLLRSFYTLYAERRGKCRWGDKSPYYVWRMKKIRYLLPEARFVHIIRDGRDVALSTVPLWFGPDTVAGVAEHWLQTLAVARRQARDLPFYVEVKYEDLVRDPAATLRRLCGFLELEWEESMLDYHRSAERRMAAETADWELADRVIARDERLDIHRGLARPPATDRIGRWREEMSSTDLSAFESVAGKTLAGLGYELGAAR
jgi:Sulfotransferase family